MEKEYFLLEDKIKEIESKFLIKNGWLKIYENDSKTLDDTSGLYCCLVSDDKLEKYSEDYSWPLSKGSEGKPTVYGDNTYKTYDEDGLEPFLFYKYFSFQETSEKYIDVAEEFVLYYRLYEKGINKQNRTFYYVSDYGELDEVLIIEPDLIKVKIKYLKEYITMRDMYFVVCYDFMRLLKKVPSEWQIQFKDDIIRESDYIYSHLIRYVSGEMQSWIMGKVFIKPNAVKKSHFDSEETQNQSFIVDVDDEGELVFEDCGKTEGNHFKLTYFKKEVLNKYYNEPDIYQVDGFSIKSKFFSVKIDNNVDDYVPVFLNDLRMLPEKEQLHWKQYNIPPKEGMNISRTYFRTMIEGNWAEEPETVDLFFKSKYKSFCKKWEKKFGWQLYKPLSTKDEYLFTSLHKITTNNVKAFCEQTLTIVKLIIDRLNEKELAKGLELEAKIRGIGKFEKFLESKGLRIPDMFEFLRNLQNLRSGLIAHSFSDSNKDCKKAIDFFGIGNESYINVLDDIFVKSIYTFNALEKHFKLDE
ncbi:hypothetical protein OU798_02640 [Prolixibacteraceae bacterium Z1-6]|uniref:Uncharacterized protein n=1 Tax=Draconibacterium aestuarii TaxID=2998507 RepID=A0A9X3J4D1_9BACT|nr:hypothetical protein [Prolixibacteraceae bacterium Z1-6]